MPTLEARTVYGPFHRPVAPGGQDAATAVKQLLSGEIWGKPASWGGSAAVKAFPGPLPPGKSGIEFWSFEPPDPPLGPRLYWRTPGPFVTIDTNAV
jgi:hypothetical protein